MTVDQQQRYMDGVWVRHDAALTRRACDQDAVDSGLEERETLARGPGRHQQQVAAGSGLGARALGDECAARVDEVGEDDADRRRSRSLQTCSRRVGDVAESDRGLFDSLACVSANV